jgi:hypothetical protein
VESQEYARVDGGEDTYPSLLLRKKGRPLRLLRNRSRMNFLELFQRTHQRPRKAGQRVGRLPRREQRTRTGMPAIHGTVRRTTWGTLRSATSGVCGMLPYPS